MSSKLTALCSLTLALGLFSGCGGPKGIEKESFRLEVTFPAGPSSVPHIVKTTLPDGFEPGKSIWEAVPANNESTEAAPVQFTEEGELVFLWRDLLGVKKQIFVIRPSGISSQIFTIEQTSEKQLLIAHNGLPVIGYVHGMHLAYGVPEDRRRACYFHPLWSADSRTVLSDDFPEDHYHHRGVFWTWPQVFVGNDTLSLWDIRGIKQRFDSWLVRETGPVFARLGVRNGWYIDDGEKVVDEQVEAIVYTSSEFGRIIDFELRWEATDIPVGIQGSADIKGYGGFSLRFAPFKEPAITTSEGFQDKDSNRIPVAWADLSARFGERGSLEGVSIFDHSLNKAFPNGWCLRHYGFNGIAWPGIEPYWLEPGRPLVARYRLWVHSGSSIDGKTSEAYNTWTAPPVATIVK